MFFSNKKIESIFQNNGRDRIYLDINSKVIPHKNIRVEFIIIRVINNVFLYTESNTFSGVFNFLKNWKFNGKKVWGSDDFEKVIGLSTYGLFKRGDRHGISIEKKFNLLSDGDKKTYEVDNINGYCKIFGWDRVFEIGKCNYIKSDNIEFKYKCDTCKSDCKNKFLDYRFHYSSGILFQKCQYVFGGFVVNPLHKSANIISTCWECKDTKEIDVGVFRCKCGKITCSAGKIVKRNGIYGVSGDNKCLSCVEEEIECYIV